MSDIGGWQFENLLLGPIMMSSHHCCCLILTFRQSGPFSASAPPEKKGIPLPHVGLSTQSAGVKEINLADCWVLLIYQPNSILLTGTEIMALSLTRRVSEQQKQCMSFILLGWCYPTNIFSIVTGLHATANKTVPVTRVSVGC